MAVMSRHAPRSVAPLAAVAAAVLLSGVAAGATLGAAPDPPVATASAATGDAVATQPAPIPVPLVVEPPASAAPAHDPGDPSTWPSGQLAAQLVFSCVHTKDLGRAKEQAAAGIGGIVLLGHPTDGPALSSALAEVRAAAPGGIAPLLASDEEGGLVQRLKDVLGPLPSAQEMGGWPDERIQQTAHDYGVRMRELGVAMALSPVADLDTPGFYPSATRRAFSADPQRAAGAAVAWSRGLESAGVASAVKHWPGHGHATDSHGTAPDVPPLSALEGADLVPFDAVTRSGASVVMVGHLRSEGLTEPGLPATLSPNAMRVLRERVGAGTVVLTDSLSMGASSAAIGLRPADAAVRALQAGADWAMSCVDPMVAVDAVRDALDNGALPRDTAVGSARRVLALKQRLGLLAVPVSTAPPSGELQTASLSDDVARLTGQAVAPDTPDGVQVQALVDGVLAQQLPVAPSGRFALTVPVGASSQVCVRVLDTGAARSTPLGCVTTPV